MEIIIPVLITVGAGLILGAVLSVLSTVFAVKTDEKVEMIEKALPGANCGGCGFAGCSDYAKAIAKGESPDKCAVGGAEAVRKICAITGDEAAAPVPRKAFVRCGGSIDYTKDKMEYRGINTCRGANMYYQGKGTCNYGCLGLGDCVRACPFGAISVEGGVAAVNRSLCIGCGKCVRACPDKLIELIPVENRIAVGCRNCEKGVLTRKACSHGCIGCAKCEKVCESGAISLSGGFLAAVDYEKCTGCAKCVDTCPTGAVKYIKDTCLNSEAAGKTAAQAK